MSYEGKLIEKIEDQISPKHHKSSVKTNGKIGDGISIFGQNFLKNCGKTFFIALVDHSVKLWNEIPGLLKAITSELRLKTGSN